MNIFPDKYLEIVKRITIFGGIPEPEIIDIVNKATLSDYYKGELIFRRNDPASEIYVIVEGTVDVTLTEDGKTIHLAQLKPGDCLGESSVIGILPHTATATATTEVKLLVLSRRELVDLMHNKIKIFSMLILNIAREIARRLHQTDNILLHYDQKY